MNKELIQALDRLAACGEELIATANAIRADMEKTTAPKEYTFTDVRKAFSAKARAGYTEQIKALITSYGADKLSAIKETDYPKLMQDLEAIS